MSEHQSTLVEGGKDLSTPGDTVWFALLGASLVTLPLWALWLARVIFPRDAAYVAIDLHHAAIAGATMLGAALTFVALRGVRSDPSAFRLYVALAFLTETVLYAFHGAFTTVWQSQPALFLLYGPVSRLAFGALLSVAIYFLPRQHRIAAWRKHIVLTCAITAILVVVIAAYALSPVASAAAGRDRIALELLALGSIATAFAMLLRTVWWRLAALRYFFGSLVLFSLASVTFLLVGRPFDATFWVAHCIFATGFLFLGYGVLTLQRRTQDLSQVLEVGSLEAELRIRQAREKYDERFRDLVGAVAHEQNNLMCVITPFLELHASDSAAQSDEDGRRPTVRVAMDRAQALSRRLLALSGSASYRRQPIEVTSFLGGVLERWQLTSGRTIAFDNTVGQAVMCVDADYLEDALRAVLDGAASSDPTSDRGVPVRAGLQLDGAAREHVHIEIANVPGDDTAWEEWDVNSFMETGPIGIGVSFARRVVLALNGELTLDQVDGHRATLTMVLPCRSSDDEAGRDMRLPFSASP